MSLDFAVLGQNGAPEKTVSLGIDMHHELITTAVAHGVVRFDDFVDVGHRANLVEIDRLGIVHARIALREHPDVLFALGQ